MTAVNVVLDNKVLAPKGSVKYGGYFSKAASGPDRASWEPKDTPHSWDCQLTSAFYPLLERNRTYAPYATYYSAPTLSAAIVRPWTAADDAKLYNKLEEAFDNGGFNALVSAGELGESVDMLANRARQLARAALAAKKGNFGKAANILSASPGSKAGRRKPSAPPSTGKPRKRPPRDGLGEQDHNRVSDSWLELQYGWLPLMGDIYTLSEQIANLDKPKKRRLRVSSFIGINPVVGFPGVAAGGGRFTKQIIAYVEEDRASWPEALGLLDPELLAWELLPFSFVADWFLPIGNWLQARAFANRAKGRFVITERTRWTTALAGVQPDPTNPRIYANGRRTNVTIKRRVYSSLPNVKLPSFKDGLLGSPLRLANAAALIASIFGASNKPKPKQSIWRRPKRKP